MKILSSFVQGGWVAGTAPRQLLVNPATEEPLAEAGTGGLDFGGALDHARSVGGPALRARSFSRRGEILLGLSKLFHQHRDELLDLAQVSCGATRGDAKFDVDGAIGTLAAYAEIGAALGDRTWLLDGEGIPLGRGAKLWGQHILVPREGVAVHVNAFNFPAWGMFEKAAVAWLAGVPVVTKPATSTALVAHRMTELAVESGLLPPGALTFLCGAAGDLLDHLGPQDLLAFTGGSDTARRLRVHPAIVANSVRVNIEADSLNAAVLGPDVAPGSEAWNLFVGDVVREMTQKTGQKCTATRRVYVPADRISEVRDALADRLSGIVVGHPLEEGVTMGPLTTADQLRDVREGVAKLRTVATVAFGDPDRCEARGVPSGRGFFHGPLLLECASPRPGDPVHEFEVFGPVATLMPYDGTVASVAPLVKAGAGGLVSEVYSDDSAFVKEAVLAWASHHGRMVLGSSKIAGVSLPPGAVMPTLVHGGPGRAGGGEELGGLRGLSFYLQRTALEGSRAVIEKLFGGGPSPAAE